MTEQPNIFEDWGKQKYLSIDSNKLNFYIECEKGVKLLTL